MSGASNGGRAPQVRVELGRTVYSQGGAYPLPSRIYLDDGKRTCPTCNGKGINPVLPHRVCPKCDGEKRIPHRGWSS